VAAMQTALNAARAARNSASQSETDAATEALNNAVAALVMKPDGRNVAAEALAMWDEEGEPMESCPHASRIVRMKLSVTPEVGDIMRMDHDD
ncbi:MAG: U32 family peptidase C-terminal domain-containing protein, partial [Lachnospiraceae bacterium]|nr:U32 family peptidase C-terminal domain-containing protein [Lachnospiraceae bacterium]